MEVHQGPGKKSNQIFGMDVMIPSIILQFKICVSHHHSLFSFFCVKKSPAEMLFLLEMDRDQILGFGFWKFHGEMGLRQVEQSFSSYFTKFLAYLMILQSGVRRWRHQNFGKSLNMIKIWQKMTKSLVQLAFNPFLGWSRVLEHPISSLLLTSEYIWLIHFLVNLGYSKIRFYHHFRRQNIYDFFLFQSFHTHQNFTSLTFVFFFEEATNEKSKIIQWKITKSEGKKNYGRPFIKVK